MDHETLHLQVMQFLWDKCKRPLSPLNMRLCLYEALHYPVFLFDTSCCWSFGVFRLHGRTDLLHSATGLILHHYGYDIYAELMNSRRDSLSVKLLSLSFDTELPDETFPDLGALCYKTLERVTRGISLYLKIVSLIYFMVSEINILTKFR